MDKPVSPKTNLLIDTAALGAFLVAFEPALTGISIHEWLSLALGLTLLVHVLLHWKWVVEVLLRFFRRLWHTSRLNFLVDSLLLVAFTLLMLSGLLISRSILPTLGITSLSLPGWRFLHSWSANLSLILVGLHFALHWRWVVNTLQRHVIHPLRGMRPAAVPVRKSEPRQ